MKKSGFTLAEVLITLGIIGVVAAMTIPSLMNQTGGLEMRAGFKKGLSAISQAVLMSVALDGDDFSSLASGTATNGVRAMFATRMNVISSTTGTISGMAGPVAANYTLFFNDGMAVSFPSAAASCTATSQTACTMMIDVNGLKGPNTISTATLKTHTVSDQFGVFINNQNVTPKGAPANYILNN